MRPSGAALGPHLPLVTVPKQRRVAVSAAGSRLTLIIKVCPFVCVFLYWFGSDKPRPSLCAAPQERECTGERTEVRLGCGFHQRPPNFPSGGTQVLCPARGLVNCQWKLASLKAFFSKASFFSAKKKNKIKKARCARSIEETAERWDECFKTSATLKRNLLHGKQQNNWNI